MANYMLVCVGGIHPSDADEAARVAQAWGAWFGRLGATVSNPGSPFGPAKTLAAGGTITDGAPCGLTRYTVIAAESLEAAAEIAKDCPHLHSFGSTGVCGTIEVYEALQVTVP